MLKVVNVTVRMDEDIKNQSEQVFKELGLTMSTAFNVFARTVARQKKIPFELTLVETNPFFSDDNQARLILSKKQIAEGHVIYKTGRELGLDDE